jgi:hypothetical protein
MTLTTWHSVQRNLLLFVFALVVVGLPVERVRAEGQPPWPDTIAARLEALALIESLNAELLSSHSATLTIEKWCADHKLAATPKIVARLDRGVDKPATQEQRQRLQVGDAELVKFRHVELACGTQVLSIADNWYVPGRLTAEMNSALETTDTPFGKAVLALAPTRETFAANVLWSPLPIGWEMGAKGAVPQNSGGVLEIPRALFEHRALLFDKNKVPFSEVDEIYQHALLAFPPLELGPK